MNYSADFTATHAAIIVGILAACLIALIALIAMARWLQRVGDTRIGMAAIDGIRPDAHAVACTEAELMGSAFNLGRTRSRTLAEKLAAFTEMRNAA